MIDIIKQTPAVYSSESRDYQVLARLYTAIFNLSKSYSDNMNVWIDNIDNKLVQLRSKTLNFNAEHNWDLNDLEAITSCFKYLVRNKGTINALKYCINILMKIEGINGKVTNDTISIDRKSCLVTVKLEDSLLTLGIVEDLMKYLLPFGFRYRIIKFKASDVSDLSTNSLFVDSYTTKETPYNKDMYVGNSYNPSTNKNKITNTFIYNNEEFSPTTKKKKEAKSKK